MPVRKRGRKWSIGRGRAIYRTRAAAVRAYRGYLAAKHRKSRRR